MFDLLKSEPKQRVAEKNGEESMSPVVRGLKKQSEELFSKRASASVGLEWGWDGGYGRNKGA